MGDMDERERENETRPTLGERKAAVLRAVVEEYVRTGEPVGSETVSDHSDLGVSSATIRNELSALEEMGYLGHPHTSAGRVPTDLGYRHFVNGLPPSKLRETQRRAVSDFFGQAMLDLEETLRGATRLLSHLTTYAGLATPPSVHGERVVHVELVSIGSALLALVVGQHGRVDKRALDKPEGLDDKTLADLSEALGNAFRGLTVAEAEARALRMAGDMPENARGLLHELADGFHEMATGDQSDHVISGGVANLAGEAARWHQETILRLFEAIERETEMLVLLKEATLASDLAVTIGGEHPSTEQWEASVVAAPYRSGETSLGTIGVVGPTRMDYRTTMSAVRAVAQRLSEIATELAD
jgi:heat-inducible transcriptional repressor